MATRKSKPKSVESSAQEDPKSPLDSAALLKSATPVLKLLAADLLARADGDASITNALKLRHGKEKSEERTADNYDTWRRDFVEQVAAAWFLSCVFVRTLEDRGLIDRNRLAGPGAEDSQRVFFALVPSLNERDYLLTVFRELQQLPAARELFDARHNPVWLLGPSAEAAKELLGLFRTPQSDAPMFRFGNADSRFLGDLYQDISENVRKRYALLQTPRFVERFILDRTLDPAIERFGLNDTNLIDPTCGSGHFLLGAFDRLFERRLQLEPGLDVRQAAATALDAVAGSDVNPYAVAIAKFRLTLSFIEKAGYTRLKDAPKLPLHVVVADSLLHNPRVKQMAFGDKLGESVVAWRGSEFKLDDEEGAKEVFSKSYEAVVGNPPYITVKDSALREKYRKAYPDSAAGKYSLAAPFCEQFFRLGRSRGYVGMITANSFMKREFGKKLIQDYLPKVNLESVINTSGAYIPGHGTPTVLLFGTLEKPQSETVLTVLASRGEPSAPDDPEQGHVWGSIANHWQDVGFEDDYITVTRTPRGNLSKHPWSLGGGGTTVLKELLEERAEKRLGDLVESIGFASFTGLDDAFIIPRYVASTLSIDPLVIREIVTGEDVRDWVMVSNDVAVAPYDTKTQAPLPLAPKESWARHLWRFRTVANGVSSFGGKTRADEGQNWWEWYRWQAERYQSPFRITFAEVSTHNHFVLDCGGRVFKQTAPIIKFPETATEDDHYALLAYLNSSTACFWMKQVSYPKAAGVTDISTEKGKPEANRYAFSGTSLQPLPIPKLSPDRRKIAIRLAKEATDYANRVQLFEPDNFPRNGESNLGMSLSTAIQKQHQFKARLRVIQEDIDWLIYEAFGIFENWRATDGSPTGARPFESTPDCATDPAWLGRHVAMQERPELQVLESAVFKRLWAGRQGVFGHGNQTIDEKVRAAFCQAVQHEAETCCRDSNVVVVSRSAMLHQLSNSQGLDKLARQFEVDAGGEWTRAELSRLDTVPYLATYRFTDSGLEKYSSWEETWANQRREDAGEPNVTCAVPPKYAQEDFRDANYWRLRGKLDVPKERFISYPGCESDEDHEPLYGWAGWNHLQRAQALAQLYNDRKAEGWDKERLVPMLAGLLELMPWLLQWHNEPSEELGGQRPGEQFSLFLEGQCAELGYTHEDLRNWRPAAKRGRGARKSPAR